MPTPSKPSARKAAGPRQNKANHRQPASSPGDAHDDVSPAWIVKSVGLVLLAAVLCGYLTLCALYYQGQWQLVLHPTKSITATPASAGLQFEAVGFDDTEAGQPQLTAWWIPAAPAASHGRITILYLHDGWGSLSDTVPRLELLHKLGANVFAIDYRGFGKSADVHPSEQRMYDDEDAAWHYLTETRKLAPGSIVLFGERLGADVAAEAALHHPQAAAVVMLAPFPSMLRAVLRDPRSDMVPVRLLFHNRFDLAAKIAGIRQPKLIGFSGDEVCSQSATDLLPPCPASDAAHTLYTAASDPKQYYGGDAQSAHVNGNATLLEFLSRFLDDAVPATAQR